MLMARYTPAKIEAPSAGSPRAHAAIWQLRRRAYALGAACSSPRVPL